MTRSTLAIAIAIVFIGSSALALQPTPSDASSIDATGTPETATTSSAQAATDIALDATDTVSRSDEKFLKTFAQVNAAAVSVGKLAAYKSENAEVQAFAKQMVDEHSKTIGAVAAIAGTASVDVKAKPDFAHKAKSAMLDISVGASFDRAYMKAMVDEHEKVVELLQKEIRDGQDANVKQLASQALLEVQEHLKMAHELRAKVSNEQYAQGASPGSKSPTTEKLAASR